MQAEVLGPGQGRRYSARGSEMIFKALAAGSGGDLSLMERTLGREDFVLVPRGTGHTFGNRSGEPARLLVIHAPAMDAYFAALHDLWNGPQPPDPAQERELMARFGMERAGPA